MIKQELRKQIGDQIKQHRIDQAKEPMTGEPEDYVLAVIAVEGIPEMLQTLDDSTKLIRSMSELLLAAGCITPTDIFTWVIKTQKFIARMGGKQ